jgi:D-arabinose 1-dehydrogenase-like Zn-dependent alcohol dehydrogenase
MAAVIPDEMDALVLRSPGVDGLVAERRPVPQPQEGEVLVRVRACAVGATVLRKVRGLKQEQLPRVPGHEIAGEIAALGAGVTDLSVGDRVLAYTYYSCGRCDACWSDRAPLCKRSPNAAAWAAGEHWDGGHRIGEDLDGGFAEYTVIPSRSAVPLQEGISFTDATMAVDCLATSLHVSRRAQLEAGERIVVVGAAGGIGIHLLQVARWFGAEPVAVDLPGKVESLVDYGAVETVDGSDPEWHRALSAPADVAVDFVGAEATLNASLASLGDRGRMVLLTPDIGRTFPVPTRWMVGGERTILGSKAHSHRELQEGVQLMIDGKVEPVITRTVSLGEATDVLREIEAGNFFARGVVAMD